MSAFNMVRFRVKPDRKDDFIEAHRKAKPDWPGLKHANLVQIGERGFVFVGEWKDEAALKAALPKTGRDARHLQPINIVIKMTECNGQPVAKVSDAPGKTISKDPGYLAYLRQVYGLEPARH